MNKKEFLSKLKEGIANLPIDLQEDIVSYYEEMINDRMDAGEKEEDIISDLKLKEIIDESIECYKSESVKFSLFREYDADKDLMLRVFNGRIIVDSSSDDKIHIMCNKVLFRKYNEDVSNKQITFSSKKRNFFEAIAAILSFSDVWSRELIRVEIPSRYDKNFSIRNSNGRVEIKNVCCGSLTVDANNGRILLYSGNVAGKVEAKSDNGRISVSATKANEFALRSGNGRIEASRSEGKLLMADSSNGRVILTSVKINKTDLKSSNGSILVSLSEVDDVMASTSNGKIALQLKGNVEEYSINASTSNGKVFFGGEKMASSYRKDGGHKKISAVSSNGSITLDII